NAQKQLNKVNLNNLQRNPKATISNAVDGLVNIWKAGVKEQINTVAKGVSAVVPASATQPIQNAITSIRVFGRKAPSYLMALADPAKAMSIAWLLNVLLKAVQKFKLKGTKTANIKPTQVTEKRRQKPNGELEKANVQAKSKGNPSETVCALNLRGGKSKPKSTSGTKRNITFALGTECLTHQDAYVSSILSFVLTRKYASNLYQLDHGEFGARWITPFTTRIVPQSEYIEETEERAGYLKHLSGFEFIGADARPVKLPNLKVGESFHNKTEDFYYSVISEKVQMISYQK
ncbi:DUF6531 domain-containing protein, partial [Acinetobacter baumannii]